MPVIAITDRHKLTDACIVGTDLVLEFWYNEEEDTGYVRWVYDPKTSKPIINSWGYSKRTWARLKQEKSNSGYAGDETWDYENEYEVSQQERDIQEKLLEAKRKLAHIEQQIPECLYTDTPNCVICGRPDPEAKFDVFEDDSEWVESD